MLRPQQRECMNQERSLRMPCKLRWALAVLATLPTTACGQDPALPVVCARPVIPSIVVEVRDASGHPNAIGATVRIRNHRSYEAAGEGYGDSLRVAAGESHGGTFLVHVAKPWHADVILRNVKVPEDQCGVAEPKRVSVMLPLLPGAPAVRQVVAPPHGYGFGHGGVQAQLTAYVEADPGISREAAWVSRDTTVARVTPAGSLTSACRSTTGDTWVVASAVVAPVVRDSVPVTVYRHTTPDCPGS